MTRSPERNLRAGPAFALAPRREVTDVLLELLAVLRAHVANADLVMSFAVRAQALDRIERLERQLMAATAGRERRL